MRRKHFHFGSDSNQTKGMGKNRTIRSAHNIDSDIGSGTSAYTYTILLLLKPVRKDGPASKKLDENYPFAWNLLRDS